MIRTRRTVLKSLAASAGGIALGAPLRDASAALEPDLILRLTAAPGTASIRGGGETHVLRYAGEVLRGRKDALKPATGFLGPTIDLWRDERVRIVFRNRLEQASIVHWHGMIVPDIADGHPRFAISPGDEYQYEFTVVNPAGTYLYHPHPHGSTGEQVYFGLAGLLIVRDRDELRFGQPFPDNDLALVIQDRRFGANNQFAFKRMMMDDMNGVLGDTVLVNGSADAAFRVTPRAYRLRLANVSNARIYKLAWSDGRPLRVIAAGNGLMSSAESPKELPFVTLAPFQRIELIENFGARRAGQEFALVSQHYASLGMAAMMPGMMGGGMMGPDQGDELLIARFTVLPGERAREREITLPPQVAANDEPARERRTQLAFRHMTGFLNERRFDMTAVASDERLTLGQPVTWTFANDGPGMSMAHPMHVHGVRFRIVERRGGQSHSDLRAGIIDSGYQDTTLVLPGERVTVAFTPSQPGLFMYHCHNLEHEDGGMMRNYLVTRSP